MKTIQFLMLLMAVFFAGSLHAQQLHWHPMQSPHSSFPEATTVTPNGTIYTTSNQDSEPSVFFRSTDHGNSWRFVSTYSPSYWINGILAVNDSVLLANFESNNEYYGGGLDTTGIYRSQDSGKTWKIVSRINGKLLGISFGNIIIQTDSLRRSTDLGLTWTVFISPGMVVIVPVQSGMLTYNNDSLLYYTRDFKTWKVIFTTKPKNYYLLVTELRDGTIAVFSDSLYLSSDNGMTWESRPINAQTFGVRPICFLSNGHLIGIDGSGSLHRSQDSGFSWTRIEDGGIGEAGGGGTLFAVDSNNDVFFGGDGYEMVRATDTSTTTVDCGPSNLPVPNIAALSNGSLVAALGGRFSEITTNNGEAWNNLLPLQAFTDWFGYNSQAGIMVEANYYNVTRFLHSKDAMAWGEITPPPYASGSTLSGFDRAGNVFMSDGSVSTDGGDTWVVREAPPGRQVIGLPDGSCVTASNGALYRSTNIGLGWQETPSAVLTGGVSCIACDSSGAIMVCSTTGAFVSSDQGKNWSSVSNGLPTDSIARQILYSTEGFWLATTGRGVFTLKEGESSWQSVSDGLDDPDILCIDMAGPGKYYAGTSLAGIYTTEAIQSSVSRSNVSLSKPALEIYPNPFSQSTTIAFTTAAAGYADIRIVNLLGEEVARLYSGELAAGNHSFTWNADRSSTYGAPAPRGIYECLVRMNGRVQAVPMVLAR